MNTTISQHLNPKPIFKLTMIEWCKRGSKEYKMYNLWKTWIDSRGHERSTWIQDPSSFIEYPPIRYF